MKSRKLKFLFIQPHWDRRYVVAFPTYEPLHGLLFGAILKDIADTVVFDRRFDTDQNLIRILNDFQPDFVCITIHTGGEIPQVKYLAALAKKIRPQAITLVGGQHATLLPEDFFNEAIDLISIGPGEETIRETAEALLTGGDLKNVAGLLVKQTPTKYYITPPRRICSGKMSWPEFDYSLIDPKYRKHYGFIFENMRSNIYTITTSGCPHRCKFCSLWASARGTFRYRDAEEVARDIINQPQTYVHLTDDNTFYHEENAMEIYRILKKKGVKKKILAYARTDTIVEKTEMLEKWKEIGLQALVVGMEAVNDKNLSAMNKKSSVDLNVQAQRTLDRLGMESWAHFVIMPEFEKEDFDDIWNFVDEHNITYPVYVAYTPVPGTPLFYDMKNSDKLSVFDYAYYNLQYMPVKTQIPKDQWYENYWGLFLKSASTKTLFKRFMNSKAFHFAPAVGRAHVMGSKAYKQMIPNIKEQIEIERTTRYEDVEHLLLPSLRKDYVPNQYYNAPSLTEFQTLGNEVVNVDRMVTIDDSQIG